MHRKPTFWRQTIRRILPALIHYALVLAGGLATGLLAIVAGLAR